MFVPISSIFWLILNVTSYSISLSSQLPTHNALFLSAGSWSVPTPTVQLTFTLRIIFILMLKQAINMPNLSGRRLSSWGIRNNVSRFAIKIKTMKYAGFRIQIRKIQFLHKTYSPRRLLKILLTLSLCVPDVPPCISPSPGYISGTAGWRPSTQRSSSTVWSPAHRSISKCPQRKIFSGIVWWSSPSALLNISVSLTWSLVGPWEFVREDNRQSRVV